MNAGAAPGEEPGDGAVLLPGLEEFDLRLAETQRDDPGTVDFLDRPGLDTQDVAVERQSALDTLDGDADVGDGGSVGHGQRWNRVV